MHHHTALRAARSRLALCFPALALCLSMALAGLSPRPVAAHSAGRADLPSALQPFPADAAPFDAGGRRALALDALTYYPQQQGLFPGHGVYQLPPAPWFGGAEPAVSRRVWDLWLPASVPLYLLATADESGQIDPSQTTVTLDGAAVPDLRPYVQEGIPALAAGRPRTYAVIDLVLPAPAPGRHHIDVRTRWAPPRPAADGSLLDETVLGYDLVTQPADSLGPWLYRDDTGTVFATLGAEKRRFTDAATLYALGYSWADVRAASATMLAMLPEGAPLPALQDQELVRAYDAPFVFRLDHGARTWLPAPSARSADVQIIDAAVLASVPVTLAEAMLIKGLQPDIYRVSGQMQLRKVPDRAWLRQRGQDPDQVIYVPERLLAALPHGSPEWVMPGGAWQDRTFLSPTLGREMAYRILLPADYDSGSADRYPVLYLLHGRSGRYDEWSGYGIDEVANQLFAAGTLRPFIIVMPQGGLGYWANQAGGPAWADYVAHDLVQHVDATYRTLPRRASRAIGGLSMGATGALQIALNYADLFGVVGAHSPALRPEAQSPAALTLDGGFARRDPISLVRNSTLATPPVIWIDAGENDPWRAGTDTLRQALQEKGWRSEWHVYAGEHDGWYWGDHLWEYLPFYGSALAH